MKFKHILVVFCFCSFNTLNAQSLSQEGKDALFELVQDEYYAEAFCKKVLGKYQDYTLFQDISKSNQIRIDKTLRLFMTYNLSIPESIWNADNVESYSTKALMCFNAYKMHKEKMRNLEGYLAMKLPHDVKLVFKENLQESRQEYNRFIKCE